MTKKWYAGANEYGYIYPLTIRDKLDECITATSKQLGVSESDVCTGGTRIKEFTAEADFLMFYPLSVTVPAGVLVKDVRGYVADKEIQK